MSRSDPAAFYLALEQTPGDPVTLQAFADWCEEQGDPDRAACLRWLARKGRFPFRYHAGAGLNVASPSLKEGWYWWAVDDPHYGRDWGHPDSCKLPRFAWTRLANPFDYTPSVFKHYEGIEAAFKALFAVWPRVERAVWEK